MSGVIAQRYARALMNLAVKADAVEDVATGLDEMAETLEESPLLAAFVEDTKVPPSTKQDVVRDLLVKAQVPELVNTFVRYLTAKRRFLLLPEIRDVYHRLADERLGRAQAEVTVAAAMSEAQEKQMQGQLEALSGKQITLTVKVDPEIMGGAITRIGSVVRDGSLRNQLQQIRQSIKEG
jgi:F-type H+-transporting ATPase subunit delta